MKFVPARPNPCTMFRLHNYCTDCCTPLSTGCPHKKTVVVARALVLDQCLHFCLIFRILTSVYEASTIQDVLYCRGKEKEYRGNKQPEIGPFFQLMLIYHVLTIYLLSSLFINITLSFIYMYMAYKM